MKFDIKALALSCAVFWGAAVLMMGLANLIFPSYGQGFLEFLSSFYPGYHATHSIIQVVLVTLYATADGLIGGAIFAWLYNCFLKTAA